MQLEPKDLLHHWRDCSIRTEHECDELAVIYLVAFFLAIVVSITAQDERKRTNSYGNPQRSSGAETHAFGTPALKKPLQWLARSPSKEASSSFSLSSALSIRKLKKEKKKKAHVQPGHVATRQALRTGAKLKRRSEADSTPERLRTCCFVWTERTKRETTGSRSQSHPTPRFQKCNIIRRVACAVGSGSRQTLLLMQRCP